MTCAFFNPGLLFSFTNASFADWTYKSKFKTLSSSYWTTWGTTNIIIPLTFKCWYIWELVLSIHICLISGGPYWRLESLHINSSKPYSLIVVIKFELYLLSHSKQIKQNYCKKRLGHVHILRISLAFIDHVRAWRNILAFKKQSVKLEIVQEKIEA